MAQWGPVARWGRRALSALGPWGPGSITGRRRSISLSVGASGIFGSRGNSEKKFSLQDVAELIRTRACQRVVVMVGAGISTPSGIPDFRLLHDKGLLLRLYTQNIDGLERVSGIPVSKLVEAHGTFASATCTVCRRSFPEEDFWADVMMDRVPCCPVCVGIMKPDIVFFGEPLPERFLLHVLDFPMADLLLILGTSLKVEPFASLSEAVGGSVPRLFINRDLVGSFAWRPRSRDVVQLGDVVHSVQRLVELLGWTEELQDLIQRETGKLDGRDK
ncbi:NAD-dependent protein deacetylase sirtuin-3, mitochondrial isoform X3 [Heterocephalus glaber]|uniref:NAD-dependent protein deacetylase sirtuin-3, mitochondrial isoform X3 n=1 Tax=Heterocephalus glaber TaxID=10181 RepID=A0AAX6TDY7_HETGA|nr:NAD-dependent protein deacetylase sirtuin-3, mitochondrial isoform X3 [Heterocephalus glaber]